MDLVIISIANIQKIYLEEQTFITLQNLVLSIRSNKNLGYINKKLYFISKIKKFYINI